MNIDFQWKRQPSADDEKSLVETKIAEILQDRNISPCHPGTTSVSLDIIINSDYPLEDRVQGSAKCQCGETLLVFECSGNAKGFTIEEFT
jgi:hypothetical protein